MPRGLGARLHQREHQVHPWGGGLGSQAHGLTGVHLRLDPQAWP